MFKEKFKYYKRRLPPPDLSSIIDLKKSTNNSKVSEKEVVVPGENVKFAEYGLKQSCEWKIYELVSCPGLLILPDPFTSEGQRLWMERCLTVYTRPPSRLNLHSHGYLKDDEDWWNVCSMDSERKNELLMKLRWATLGYHHNWDSKVYSENSWCPMPVELYSLSSLVAEVCGFQQFQAQAAIINYYHFGSTLSGHTDHSEPNLQAPLLSFSFGQDALFLVGDVDPCCVRVNSGDVVVMSGGSRLVMHAVPAILPARPPLPWLEDQPSDWLPFQQYMSTSRININVRQVLDPGSTCLKDTLSSVSMV